MVGIKGGKFPAQEWYLRSRPSYFNFSFFPCIVTTFLYNPFTSLKLRYKLKYLLGYQRIYIE